MLNSKQRGRRLSDIISEIQQYISKAQGQVETPQVQEGLNKFYDARRKLTEDGTKDDEK